MRTCQSCGKENPMDQDFCSCGEYLRWEPTGYMQAITPEQAAEAKQEAEPPPSIPAVQQAAPVVPETPGNGHGNGHSHPRRPRLPRRCRSRASPSRSRSRSSRPVAKTMVRGAVPPPPAPPPPGATTRPSRPRSCCAAPTASRPRARSCTWPSSPGTEQQIFALIRNQSGIVDNYDLRVEGMPEDWWSISARDRLPGAVRLRRDLRAGGRGPAAPAAHAGRRGARVGAQGRRRLQGAPDRRRVGAAGAARRALHRHRHRPAPAAPPRPQEGELRRHGDQPRQRAGAGRARRRGPRRRADLRLQPPAAGDPAGRRRDHADAGPAAEADLDGPRPRPQPVGADGHRRGGRRARRRRAAERRGARERAAAQEAPVLAAPPRAARAGRLSPARLQAADVPAGRADGPGRPQRAHAAVPRAAGAGPAPGPGERRRDGARQGQDARHARPRRRVRADGADDAVAGHVPPEAVAAVVADPGDPAARAPAAAALQVHPSAQRRRAGRRRQAVGLRGRADADEGQARAGPEHQVGRRRQGARGLRRQPDARGRQRGHEGLEGHDPDRRRQRPGEGAEDRRPLADRRRQGAARRGAHARPVLAPERQAGSEDRVPDPGRGRGRQEGHAGQLLLPRPEAGRGRRQGRRQQGRGQGR